ncbi:hypothetical protein AB0B45_33540 [Nonomuraea sp. NPDC049152]|uniref:hypothetical protein n=1 Tax=Nonomuraea sp. NPDC049152 TaxID=3154350 RepID=UPI0033FD8FFE
MTPLPGAQVVIQTILRRTNLLMAGKRVSIVGDVPGLASRLRAMGAHPGAALAEADLVIGDDVDREALRPGAILATTRPGHGEHLREGVTAQGRLFVVDLTC